MRIITYFRAAGFVFGFGVLMLPGVSPAEEPVPFERASVYFPIGASHLTPAASEFLDEVARRLRTAHEAQAVIVGYADRTGNTEINRRIAAARAFSVENALLERGVAAEQLRIVAETRAMTAQNGTSDTGQVATPVRFIGMRRADVLAVSAQSLGM